MELEYKWFEKAAGAEESEIEAVAERLKREGKVRADLAAQFLEELRAG